MPRGRPKKTQPEQESSDAEETPKVAASKPQKTDKVRVELMKRIYIARDPETTQDTWLHHPDCPPKAPICAELECRAFRGLEVGDMIDKGWWNDVPGDH